MQSTVTNEKRSMDMIWYEYIVERYLWMLYSVHYEGREGGIKWNSQNKK